MVSRSIICRSLKAEANNIDLRGSEKSQYFAITEFNNNNYRFIIRSPTCCLIEILGKQSDLPFSHKSDHKKEKSVVSFTHEQNIICNQTQLDDIAHDQTIINFCRQLFAGHVVGSRPMKRNNNLLRTMIIIIVIAQTTLESFCELAEKYRCLN